MKARMDTNALFTQYLNTVNRAIGEHRDEPPYKQLLGLGEKIIGDKKIGVAVYKDDSKTPHDWFTLRLDGKSFTIVEHGKKNPDVSWKVKENHLREVVQNPEEYIRHPYKLDLDWLKTRIGIS